MFFVLSKLLLFLIQPLDWVIAFLVVGLIRRKTRLGRRLLAAGVVMTVFFTNPLVLNIVTRAWEVNLVTIASLEEPFDVGIVLGGFSRVIERTPDRLHLNEHPNRFIHAIELYKAGKIRKILVAGGSPALIGEKRNDSEMVRRFLLNVGIPSEDILIEARSRNTRENAVFSAEFLAEQMPGARCLLITSAFHMRRAAGCFRVAGIEAKQFATDMSEDAIEHWTPNALIVPNPRGFERWGMLVKEWVGMVAYKVRGYA